MFLYLGVKKRGGGVGLGGGGGGWEADYHRKEEKDASMVDEYCHNFAN